jgi:hypothetical protein
MGQESWAQGRRAPLQDNGGVNTKRCVRLAEVPGWQQTGNVIVTKSFYSFLFSDGYGQIFYSKSRHFISPYLYDGFSDHPAEKPPVIICQTISCLANPDNYRSDDHHWLASLSDRMTC